MAFRSLTEAFVLMRNNALQNKHFFSENISDDRTALVSKNADKESSISSRISPDWIHGQEELQYEFDRIKTKVKDLQSLHDKHLNRPTLDDSVDEEHAIEILTKEMTQMFGRAHRLLQSMSVRCRHNRGQEQSLSSNVLSNHARSLQELSSLFRRAQSVYLRKLRLREERSSSYFSMPAGLAASAADLDEDDDGLAEYYDRGFTQQQLFMVEDNSQLVQQRESEIHEILRSIQQLNTIFQDVAQMVVEQGSIVDRIEFNVEKAHSKVEQGLGELKKAEKYQKKNKKMLIIVVLACVVIVLIVILIIRKSQR